ncbi:alpha/beta hydrolase [Rhodovibrionaceae bacterium A322]
MGEALWRGYDKAGLDKQFNLRDRTPEHPEIFARWTADSAATRAAAGPNDRFDLSYGPDPRHRLDYFDAGDNTPLLIFIHGGYWQALSKDDFSAWAPAFVKEGVSVAMISYRLCPQVTIPEIVDDVQAAVGWIYNEKALAFDRSRIFVSGHSAGGHLTAMALLTDWTALGLPEDLLKGGCCISGLYDLEPLSYCYQQDVLNITPQAIASASPQRLPQTKPLPMILTVGETEPEEFRDQQRDFADLRQQANFPIRIVDLPARHHFSAMDALCEEGHPLYKAVLDLVKNGKID